MPFISTSEVAAYLQTSDNAAYAAPIVTAEALIAAALGTESLV